MKTRLIVVALIIAMILSAMIINVNAATGTVSVTPSKTELNPGDTFTVTIAASCDEGINGLQAVITYDNTKLELVESKVADNKWLDLGQNVESGIGISLMCNSTDPITNTNLYILTFKVKDSITANTTATVTVSGATLYSDASQTYNEGTKEVTISIVIPSNTDTGNNNPGTTTGGDNTGSGNENPGTTDNGNNNENNNPGTTTDGDNTGSGNDSIATTDNESENTETKTGGNSESDSKDTTTKTDKLPKTGENDYIIIAGAVIMIIGTVSFIGYRKYNQI